MHELLSNESINNIKSKILNHFIYGTSPLGESQMLRKILKSWSTVQHSLPPRVRPESRTIVTKSFKNRRYRCGLKRGFGVSTTLEIARNGVSIFKNKITPTHTNMKQSTKITKNTQKWNIEESCLIATWLATSTTRSWQCNQIQCFCEIYA